MKDKNRKLTGEHMSRFLSQRIYNCFIYSKEPLKDMKIFYSMNDAPPPLIIYAHIKEGLKDSTVEGEMCESRADSNMI